MLLYCICLSCQVYGYVIKDAIHYYSRPSYSIRNSYKQFRIPYFTKRSRIEIITFSKNKALLNKKWQIVYQNNHFLSWTNFDTNFDYDAIFDENPRQLR